MFNYFSVIKKVCSTYSTTIYYHLSTQSIIYGSHKAGYLKLALSGIFTVVWSSAFAIVVDSDVDVDEEDVEDASIIIAVSGVGSMRGGAICNISRSANN